MTNLAFGHAAELVELQELADGLSPRLRPILSANLALRCHCRRAQENPGQDLDFYHSLSLAGNASLAPSYSKLRSPALREYPWEHRRINAWRWSYDNCVDDRQHRMNGHDATRHDTTRYPGSCIDMHMHRH